MFQAPPPNDPVKLPTVTPPVELRAPADPACAEKAPGKQRAPSPETVLTRGARREARGEKRDLLVAVPRDGGVHGGILGLQCRV